MKAVFLSLMVVFMANVVAAKTITVWTAHHVFDITATNRSVAYSHCLDYKKSAPGCGFRSEYKCVCQMNSHKTATFTALKKKQIEVTEEEAAFPPYNGKWNK